MAEQSLTRVEEEKENLRFPKEYIEGKLLECLQFLYESSRISKDINVEETTLASMQNIRNRLTHDDHQPLAALETIDGNINKVQDTINSLKNKNRIAEENAVGGFMDIFTSLMTLSDKRSNSYESGYVKALQGLESRITAAFDGQISIFGRKIMDLEKTKLNGSAQDEIKSRLEEVRNNILNILENSKAAISQANHFSFQAMEKKVDTFIAKSNYENIVAKVQEQVTKDIENKMKAKMEAAIETKTQQRRALNEKELSDEMKAYVKKKVSEQVGPASIRRLITALPEYQVLTQMATNKDKLAPKVDLESSREMKFLKEAMDNMAKEMNTMKTVVESTRSIADVLAKQGLPAESLMTSFNHTAAVKHMEDVQLEITTMYNNLKAIDTVLDINNTVTTTPSEPNTNEMIENKNGILDKIEDIEIKQKKIRDFITQAEETVLHEDFPGRLDAAMTRIQSILSNHETFILYLIDPIAAIENIKQNNVRQTGQLNPAVLHSITELVQKRTQEYLKPLQQRVQSLEVLVNAKQQKINSLEKQLGERRRN